MISAFIGLVCFVLVLVVGLLWILMAMAIAINDAGVGDGETQD